MDSPKIQSKTIRKNNKHKTKLVNKLMKRYDLFIPLIRDEKVENEFSISSKMFGKNDNDSTSTEDTLPNPPTSTETKKKLPLEEIVDLKKFENFIFGLKKYQHFSKFQNHKKEVMSYLLSKQA